MPEARIEIELDDGALVAFVACPAAPDRRPPILLLSDHLGVTEAVESNARRLSAHNYFILAPELSGWRGDDRREALEACLDHLAGERRVDDARVGVLGFGVGADLALGLAALRAERIAAVAAYGGRGFSPRLAREIVNRINGVVRIGHTLGTEAARLGVLERALCEAGVDFDVEMGSGEPDWRGLADVFDRALQPLSVALPTEPAPAPAPRNLWTTQAASISCSAERASR